ncbi:very-short-patch-repair endonuclease [Microbacterium sp. BE35]|uniref:endonuclease domain-containing protein n=1 Tax=Microbacterium sp. BE35 TaxID=2817773 RepID=UPI00286329B1|nr:type IV toxin-antitoxin system AbiEi family antitoxin domain-containing protein [Microbacterium sp. BE35]MDR7190272.1 very-short-patch-repair endonuclease [Microbacterium sp. BE35]
MCTASPPAVTTYRELRASGLSRSKIAAALADGSLISARRGVYERRGVCADIKTAAAHGGWVVCVSAAQHLGLWVAEHGGGLHVGLRAHGRAYSHPDCSCVVHWSDQDDVTRGAFGVPSVRVVLRQILRCQGLEAFFVALESALRRRTLSNTDLDWLRRGTNADAREAITFARSDADSGLESLLRWRLRRRGLRVRTQQSITSVGRVDFVIGERLIVEVDGAPNHDSESHRHKDLVRDANAAAWGFVTLRFDYALVVHDWDTVELAILGLVDRGLHLA